jgi:hypothetical protein
VRKQAAAVWRYLKLAADAGRQVARRPRTVAEGAALDHSPVDSDDATVACLVESDGGPATTRPAATLVGHALLAAAVC